MRKQPRPSLFSQTLQEVLVATCLRPEHSWYLSDLAHHLKRSPSSLQRPLAQLTSAGILKKRADGGRTYFQADPQCPILPELQSLLTKTVGLKDVLENLLYPLRPKIDISFIFGSVAQNKHSSTSDIDLLIVGSVKLADISLILRSAEQKVGRIINVQIYTKDALQKKYRNKNHFVRSLRSTPKIFMIGNNNEFEKILG